MYKQILVPLDGSAFAQALAYGWPAALILAVVAACSRGEQGSQQGSQPPDTVSTAPVAASADLVTDSSVATPGNDLIPAGKGSIKACAPAVTSADSSRRVRSGARIFRQKQCSRCHTVGEGYMDGPDLVGVTDRRTCDWIVGLLTDTENMIQLDPDLQQLRIEHFVDMPNLNLSLVNARDLFDYLRAASTMDSVRAQRR